MNTLFEPKLKGDYFKYKAPWLFNSRDLMPFLYMALGLIISALLILFLCFYFLLGTLFPGSQTQNQVQNLPSQTPAVENSILSAEPASASPSVFSFEASLLSAKEQPTYELQLQAFTNLITEPEISEEQKQNLQTSITELTKKTNSGEKIIQSANSYMDKQYFSAAIKLIQPILDEGKIWGSYHTQALEIKEKSVFKRVDYYLIKGRIPEAKKALQKALDTELNPDKIKEYQDKIQKLEKVG